MNKYSYAVLLVLFLGCSVFFAGCREMTIGDLQDATRLSTIFISKSGDIFTGYYEIEGTFNSYYIMITRMANGTYVPSIEILPTTTVKNTIRAMVDTGLFTKTTWNFIPYEVQTALFKYGQDFFHTPLGAPIILAPMIIIITPVPTPYNT
jgi:hypothetical protein